MEYVMENKDLATLEAIAAKLGAGSPAADVVRIDDPVSAIEDGLVDFVGHAFDRVKENHALENAINAQLLTRVSEANYGQLIELKGTVTQSNNDADSRLINPFAGAILAKQAAELADGPNGPADEIVYKKASKDVLQGLTALNQLLSVATKIASEPRQVTAEVTVVPSSPSSSESASE
jgi:hypothetical protein